MTTADYFILAIFVALGLFSVAASIFNIEWYFRTEGAAFFVRRWGRRGARIFYACLGVALVACGLLGMVYGLEWGASKP